MSRFLSSVLVCVSFLGVGKLVANCAMASLFAITFSNKIRLGMQKLSCSDMPRDLDHVRQQLSAVSDRVNQLYCREKVSAVKFQGKPMRLIRGTIFEVPSLLLGAFLLSNVH